MRNEAFRAEVFGLVSKGLSQIKVARVVRKSRERIRQICDEAFGKGVAVGENRISHAGKIADRCIQRIKNKKRGDVLLWAVEEAIRRGLEVSLPLNPKNNECNVFSINGIRVNVQVSRVPNINITTEPLYHWEGRNSKDVQCYILLALAGGFVKYTVIIPAEEMKRGSMYLPVKRRQQSRPNEYLWRYIDRWDFFQVAVLRKAA